MDRPIFVLVVVILFLSVIHVMNQCEFSETQKAYHEKVMELDSRVDDLEFIKEAQEEQNTLPDWMF